MQHLGILKPLSQVAEEPWETMSPTSVISTQLSEKEIQAKATENQSRLQGKLQVR